MQGSRRAARPVTPRLTSARSGLSTDVDDAGVLTPEILGRTLAEAPDPELARVAVSRVGRRPRRAGAARARRRCCRSRCGSSGSRPRRPTSWSAPGGGRDARRRRPADARRARAGAGRRHRAPRAAGRAAACSGVARCSGWPPAIWTARRWRTWSRRSRGRRGLPGGGAARWPPATRHRGDRPRQARRLRAELRQRRRPDLRARRRRRRCAGRGRARRGRADPAARRADGRGHRAPRRPDAPSGRARRRCCRAAWRRRSSTTSDQSATWERQAMIKARPVAGDPWIGSAFVEGVAPFVYPEELAPRAIDDVRRTKVRLEEYIRQRGKELTEVKRGRGGIRDVEFAVQLLQIVHGRRDPTLREPNTLRALADARRGGVRGPGRRRGARRRLPVPAPARASSADRPRPADARPAGRSARAHDARAFARAGRRRRVAGRVRAPDRARPRDPRAAVLPAAAGGVRGSGGAEPRRGPPGDRGAARRTGVRVDVAVVRGAAAAGRPAHADGQGAGARVPGDGAGARAGLEPRPGAGPVGAHRGGGGGSPRSGRRARRGSRRGAPARRMWPRRARSRPTCWWRRRTG